MYEYSERSSVKKSNMYDLSACVYKKVNQLVVTNSVIKNFTVAHMRHNKLILMKIPPSFLKIKLKALQKKQFSFNNQCITSDVLLEDLGKKTLGHKLTATPYLTEILCSVSPFCTSCKRNLVSAFSKFDLVAP